MTVQRISVSAMEMYDILMGDEMQPVAVTTPKAMSC